MQPRLYGSAGAMRLLQIEIWLLFLFPAWLRIDALGAPGNPAILFAIGLFALWSISVLAPSIPAPARCGPVRLVLALFWLAVLLSYFVMHLDPLPKEITSVSDIYIVTLIAFSGVALYAAEAIRTMDDLMRIIRTFIAAAALMSLIAIMQARLNFDVTNYIEKLPFFSTYGEEAGLVQRGFGRPAGTATHPIEFGVVTGLALALAIHLRLYDRAWSKLRRWSAVAVIGLGIPVAVSRSAIVVGVAVLAVFFAGATRQARARVLPVLLVMVVAVFVAFPGMIGTLTRLFVAGRSDSSIADRVSDYSFVESTVESSPWLGRGPGSLLPAVRILDNQYLLSLIEIGFVGLCALLVLLGAIWTMARSGRAWFEDEGDRLLGQMLAAAGLGIVVAAFTFDGLSFPMFKASIALFLGLAGRYWTLARAERARAVDAGRPVSTSARARRVDHEDDQPVDRTAPSGSGRSRGARPWPAAFFPRRGGGSAATGRRALRRHRGEVLRSRGS